MRNSSSAFQREIRRVLDPFLGKGVEQFIDDIIVHTATEAEHLVLLDKVFDTLVKEGIKLKRSKGRFLVKEVTFLGHVVSAGQLRPSPERVKAITEFPVPQNIHQSRSFVGMANFFRDFIPNFSEISAPLTSLNQDNFQWKDEQQQAFEVIKQKLCSEPVLALFDPSLPLTLTTDASLIGIGAMLSQNRFTRKLTSTGVLVSQT